LNLFFVKCKFFGRWKCNRHCYTRFSRLKWITQNAIATNEKKFMVDLVVGAINGSKICVVVIGLGSKLIGKGMGGGGHLLHIATLCANK
jgi:hypothetical protein